MEKRPKADPQHQAVHPELFPEPRVIKTEGGESGFLRTIGHAAGDVSTSDRRKLRGILEAERHVVLNLPDKRNVHGLLTWEVYGPPRKRVLLQTLSAYMLPEAHVLMSHRLDRRYVPIPTTLPPLIGSPQHHAAQCNFQLALLYELSMGARELAETGDFALDRRRLTRMADMAGLPSRLIAPVLDAWCTGTKTAPPVLAKRGNGRYGFASAYAREASSLLALGKRADAGHHGGVATARKRARQAEKR